MIVRDDDGGTEVRLQCDECGDLLDRDFDDSQFNQMVAYAKEKGWAITVHRGRWEHHCPDCKPSGLAAQQRLFGKK